MDNNVLFPPSPYGQIDEQWQRPPQGFLSRILSGGMPQPGTTGGGILAALQGKDPTALMILSSALLQNSGPMPGNPGFGARLGGAVGNALSPIMNQQSIQERTALMKESREFEKHQFEMDQAARDERRSAATKMLQQYRAKLEADDGEFSLEDQQKYNAAEYAAQSGEDGALLKMINPELKEDTGSVDRALFMNHTPASIAAYKAGGSKDASLLKSKKKYVQAGDGVVIEYDDAGYRYMRDPEEVARGKSIIASAKAADEFNIGYGGALTAAQDTRQKLSDLKKEMAGLATGPGGEVAALANPKLQEMQARLSELTLLTMGEFKRLGASLSPMTAQDLEFIKSIGPQITKYPNANAALLDRAVKAYERIEADLKHQKDFLDTGGSMLDYKGRSRSNDDAPKDAPKKGRTYNPETGEFEE